MDILVGLEYLQLLLHKLTRGMGSRLLSFVRIDGLGRSIVVIFR